MWRRDFERELDSDRLCMCKRSESKGLRGSIPRQRPGATLQPGHVRGGRADDSASKLIRKVAANYLERYRPDQAGSTAKLLQHRAAGLSGHHSSGALRRTTEDHRVWLESSD